jgi:hypothetical protein
MEITAAKPLFTNVTAILFTIISQVYKTKMPWQE